MTIAQQMADFVCGTRVVPHETRWMAVNAVVDLTTACVAGSGTDAARSAARAAHAIWGRGSCSVWLRGAQLTATGAAFANSISASALDLDDGHRAAAGHPGAAIIPAVLAEAEEIGCETDDILTAIAIGYEIAIRVAASRDLAALDTLVTGRWCGQGVAAAVGWMRGLPNEQIAQAMALAGSCAPNLSAVAYSSVMGNHLKEGIAWATATGLSAVELAAQGFTGPVDIFDNADFFDPDTLQYGNGPGWYLDGIYFKPYSCCRWAHAPIDAILTLLHREDIRPSDVVSIDIHTFSRSLRLNNEVAPRTLEGAQYSLPFCVALAAVRGVDALVPMKRDYLNDADVIELSRRVGIVVDPEFDAMFSASVPCRLEVKTTDRTLEEIVMNPKGEPSNPMSRDDLIEKFLVATIDVLENEDRDRGVAAFRAAFDGDLRYVIRFLTGKSAPAPENSRAP